MNYIIVPTSKCLYQQWQLRLLKWSADKVNQKGKIIFLASYDHNHFSETLNFNYPGVEVIELPDWAKEWEIKNEDWWGGIPNKYEAINWLCQNKKFNNKDQLLFLDPDMIFTSPIILFPKNNEVIGQKWEGFHSLEEFPTNFTESIMYPFTINFYTLKKIVKDYKQYCIDIRNTTKRWESEMWGLHHSLEKNNIKITPIEDLGRCVAWNDNNSINKSSIIHFPSAIESKEGEKLFFKQDYTTTPTQKIEINKARNLTDKILLSNIDQERTDYIYNAKWNFPHLFKFYTGKKGYLFFQPWPGGFNNIRMSLEQAVCLAYLTNRTLVLPPSYNMYLLEGESNLEDFFDLDNIGIKSIEFKDLCLLKNVPSTLDGLKNISKVLDYDAVANIINFEKVPVPSKFTKGRSVINSEDLFDDSEILFLNKNLLGAFDQSIYTKHETSLKQLIGKYITYKNDLRDIAWQFINFIGDKSYYSIHIRRNDFQYKDLFISGEEIFNNIKGIIPEGSKLYIATDTDDESLLSFLKEKYQVTLYNDLKNQLNLEDFNINWVPIIEQLICSRGIKFIGNDNSTLSSYIYKLRCYMDDIEDKKYYLNTSPKQDYPKLFLEDPQYRHNWIREYQSVSIFDDSIIFVSIASYKDTQIFDTLKSLYEEISDPNRVRVVVHLQDTNFQYTKILELDYPNLEVIFTPFNETKGVVWARNRIKDKYNGEDYFLTIDSHSRFKQNWDLILINQLNSIEEDKVVLSTYPNHFDIPDPEKKYLNLPYNAPLVVDKFIDPESNTDNRLKMKNLSSLEDYQVVDTKWVSAGFAFTTGEWINEIKIPEQMIFKGEEEAQTFLSYLKGWNIKLASEATIWHNYEYRTTDETPYRTHNNQYHLEDNSIEEINNLLFNQTHQRSLQDLENYLDIKFKIPQTIVKPPQSLNNNKENTIFVSIASYRDKELIKTVKNCLSRAKHPEKIKIGVCWQYDETENIDELDNISQVSIEKIYWKDVKGSVCWARKLIQDKFFNNEDYYFQVDSHTLFAEYWDEILINMYNSLPTKKAVISVGPPYYYDLRTEGGLPPEENSKVRYKEGILFDDELQIQKLDNAGGIHFMYGFLPAPDISKPIPSRHISAALLFTIGQWVKDVPYDDNLYFHGEEPTLTLRSYTHGYDLFNPNKFVAWHLKYLFPIRKRHWNTFPQEIIDQFTFKSNEHYKKIITGEEQSIYGIGKERTLKEWEIYSGISFKDQKAHPKTYKGYVPNPVTIENLEEWKKIKNP